MPKLTTSLKTLSWAAYLACSWTWCIGMFLPILLLRDYGPWGFVVFAVPNVLGAAAMGTVLTRDQSRRIIEKHKPLIEVFSLVTISYHFFFAGWLQDAGLFVGYRTGCGTGAVTPFFAALLLAAIAIGLFVAPRGAFRQRGWACVLWLASMWLAVSWWRNPPAQTVTVDLVPMGSDSLGLMMLAPTMAFGFLLCPYLDATFHRARSEQSLWSGRASFAIGFILFFVPLILFTTSYRDMMTWMISDWPPVGIPDNTIDALATYIAAQAVFTTAVHCWELRVRKQLIRTLSVAGFGALAGVFASSTNFSFAGMTLGELTYRLFLSFYGLVFPAYVYLCMIPTPDRHAGLSGPSGRRKRNTWLAAIAIAAPFFWMGFIERRELFLIPGLAIILLARLTLPAGPGLPKRTTTS